MGWIVYGVKRKHTTNLPVDHLFSYEDVDIALATSDYIVNIMPENSDSHGYFNANTFKKMKSSALFCNVGRGSAVIDDDLEEAVENGVISGAIMDAASRSSYKSENIISTNHSSSLDPVNSVRFDSFFTEQLNMFIKQDI